MQRSQKLRSLSTRKQPEKNLPSLRSTTLISKAIIALSKVDFDSRNIQRDATLGKTVLADKDHLRSKSGLANKKNKEGLVDTKALTKTNFESPSSYKLALRELREEQSGGGQVQIDRAKTSSKSYGIVRAYAANSHPGPVLSYNEDRICIVTNLTKTNVKVKQVSFFGVYDGNEGVARADYMRDNFHLQLAEDHDFLTDIQGALHRTLKRINAAIADDPRFSNDTSTVGFAIILVHNEEVYYLQSGTCKAVFSCNFGRSIFFPTKNENIFLAGEAAKKSKSVGELLRRGKSVREGVEVEFRKFVRSENLDFVLLGSEGVFENIKIREIGRKLWIHLLKNREESIHFAVGQANNLLLSEIFSTSLKNASLIIVAFQPVQSCQEMGEWRQELVLPYLPRESRSQIWPTDVVNL